MAQAERKIEHLLLVIDESPASVRAVEYTGNLLRRRQGFRIHLLHPLPPLPPELLEFGGAENPRKEQALENELRQDNSNGLRRHANPLRRPSSRQLGCYGKPASRPAIFFVNSRIRLNRAMPPGLYLSTRKQRSATQSLLATKRIPSSARSLALT